LRANKTQVNAIKETLNEVWNVADVKIFVSPKKTYKYESFTMFFQAANLWLTKTLTPISCKLLIYFNSITAYGNRVDKDISDICGDLKYSRMQLNRGIKELESYDIIRILKLDSDKRRNIYILNPYQSWKGAPIERAIINKIFPDNQLQFDFGGTKKPLHRQLRPNVNFLEQSKTRENNENANKTSNENKVKDV